MLKLKPPGKPGTLELTDLTHASATLQWEASNPEFRGTRFRVYLNGFLVRVVTEPRVSLTHLSEHTDFRVEVRAVNDAGISQPSFNTFRTKLRPPTNLRFNHRNGICRLAWDPVFRKYPAHDVSINGRVFTVASGRWGHNFKLLDLSPGPVPHHFKFVVVARLDDAQSAPATLESTVEDDVPPSRPGAPVVSDITDTSATVTWSPSDDNTGVAGYRVVLNGLLVFRTADTFFNFNGLSSGTYHHVFVRAQDKDGNLSSSSGLAVFKTTGQAPSPRPDAPEAKIIALTSTSARLEWKYQKDIPVSGVRIQLDGEFHRDILFLESYRLDNLLPNAEHEISISVFDVFGQLSDPTVLIHEPRDLIPPSMPGNLHKTGATRDSITLKWDDSTDDVGVYEYVIYNNQEYFDRTPMTQYTAVDLLPGAYTFEVCAIDGSGNVSDRATISTSLEGEI
ncbi:hypothetical protein DKY63_05310 [Pseudomonas putida]|uniref:Fibronectin type-III domain-containing protein n=1 Tax=Pseudomonas putida TaxID=303 RepID=A0A2Z4RHB3_PSEPU|nr:hypothetical protein DKY63_05310 [Pseudomonas putida]